jgi:hypothetical protein
MLEAAASPWERIKRAKLREIEAHRIAVRAHTSTAAYFESIGREAQAAVVRERAERARVMLETAIREAEVIAAYWSQPFIRSDSGQGRGGQSATESSPPARS